MDLSKMQLAAEEAAAVLEAQRTVADSFLYPDHRPPHVVGMGVGVKWTGGEPTGRPALVILVTEKKDPEELRPQDLIPREIGGVETDVLAIGHPCAGTAPLAAAARELALRVRPVRGGFSVGHYQTTAGTVATAVYDLLPEGKLNPPRPGIGVPSRYFLLSNNHVLANQNSARAGDPILQPGPYDGGQDPEDRIARLSRFVPLTFYPPTPLHQHQNLVDAALAEGDLPYLDREIYWIGRVRGWKPRCRVEVGMVVQKTGRTTGYTVGRITVINATVDVSYGAGRVARFRDQIVTTSMSAPGDSGSLLTTLDGVAVGLIFAGSPLATIANQIENVRSLLRVEVGEVVE